MSVFFPMLLGVSLANQFPEWRWVHYPFHSMVESLGALSALTISTLMLLMIRHQLLDYRYIVVTFALTVMGVLDGFHAAFHAGGAFVWLHSIATCLGGVIFAFIWVDIKKFPIHRYINSLLVAAIIISLSIGTFTIIYPELVPEMVVNNEFSLLAKLLNIIGGTGFLVGAAFFIHDNYKNIERRKTAYKREDIVFANHCVLFGIAGLLFESSLIWDAGWWWWHLLRLLAYLVVLMYFFVLFKEQLDMLNETQHELKTVNKRLEVRVKERTLELEVANKAKDDFLSSMSHEFRTPMNAILGFSQLLHMEKRLSDEHKNSVDEILDAGKHLMGLINDVLDFSTIQSGGMKVKLVKTDICSVVRDSVNMIIPLANERNIKVNNYASDCDSVYAYIDELKFRQVMINLLSNAVKYNRESGEINVAIKKAGSNKIRLMIQDTGEGMSEKELQNLFEPFERLKFKNSSIEGAGIGLVLSKKLMDLMGGQIIVTSDPGKGSSFFIELDEAIYSANAD